MIFQTSQPAINEVGVYTMDSKIHYTRKFSNNDNKFILLLRKIVYLQKYMDEWEKFNETSLPEKEEFYSNLIWRILQIQITCMQKEFVKDLEINTLGEYHDLYLKSDTLLLADVFESFRKMCLKIYHQDPAKSLSAPGLEWQAPLKETEVVLELLTDNDMLLMVEKNYRWNMSLY